MNKPIKPEDIKVGQKVACERTKVAYCERYEFVVAEVTPYSVFASHGGWVVYPESYTWFLIEDVPDPDSELIERLARHLYGGNWDDTDEATREAYREPGLKWLALIRETHDITPKLDE